VSPRRTIPPLEAAVRRELRELARRSPGADKTPEAETALALARAIEQRWSDEAGLVLAEPLAARVSAARVLNETLDRLRATAPDEKAVDRVDDLAAKRQKRRAS